MPAFHESRSTRSNVLPQTPLNHYTCCESPLTLGKPIDARPRHLQQFFHMTTRPFQQHPNTRAHEAPSETQQAFRLAIRHIILVWNSYELDMTPKPRCMNAGNVRSQNYQCGMCSRSKVLALKAEEQVLICVCMHFLTNIHVPNANS